jgi:hypothetical protein
MSTETNAKALYICEYYFIKELKMKQLIAIIATTFALTAFAADTATAPAAPAKEAPKSEMKLAKKKADKDAEAKAKKDATKSSPKDAKKTDKPATK